MNNTDEWWATVRKASQHWLEVKDHQSGAAGKGGASTAFDSRADAGGLAPGAASAAAAAAADGPLSHRSASGRGS